MIYEIAKQLKDAGFPVPICGNINLKKFPNKPYIAEGQDAVYEPTLSELIEACGRIWVGPCEKGWHSGFDGHPYSHLDENRPQGCGDTPEEAVARLWLALNEKP